jgi:hypothetical protein
VFYHAPIRVSGKMRRKRARSCWSRTLRQVRLISTMQEKNHSGGKGFLSNWLITYRNQDRSSSCQAIIIVRFQSIYQVRFCGAAIGIGRYGWTNLGYPGAVAIDVVTGHICDRRPVECHRQAVQSCITIIGIYKCSRVGRQRRGWGDHSLIHLPRLPGRRIAHPAGQAARRSSQPPGAQAVPADHGIYRARLQKGDLIIRWLLRSQDILIR